MAKATFVKRAYKNIYEVGKIVTYEGKAGTKRAGQKLQKLDRTIPANKDDKIYIHVGESYYRWQFLRGPINYSKEKPRRSQLTRSEFFGWLYDMEDETIRQAEITVTPDALDDIQSALEAMRDEWVDEINSQRDEQQERMDAMPEQLQDSSVFPERIDGLESWVSDLEGVDCEIDLEELKSQAAVLWDQLDENEKAITEPADREEWVMDRLVELVQERADGIIGELQSQSSGL